MTIYSVQDFNDFAKDVALEYGFSLDDPFYEEAVATVILHAPPDMGNISWEYVGMRVGKMLANKVAYDKIQDLKVKRQQEDTAKAAKAVEAPDSGSLPVSNQEVS